jgi:hypothetical protein
MKNLLFILLGCFAFLSLQATASPLPDADNPCSLEPDNHFGILLADIPAESVVNIVSSSKVNIVSSSKVNIVSSSKVNIVSSSEVENQYRSAAILERQNYYSNDQKNEINWHNGNPIKAKKNYIGFRETKS